MPFGYCCNQEVGQPHEQPTFDHTGNVVQSRFEFSRVFDARYLKVDNVMTRRGAKHLPVTFASNGMAAFPFDSTNRIFPTERQHLDRQWKRIAQQGHWFRLIYDNDPVTGVGRYDFLSQESATAAFDEDSVAGRLLIGAIDRDIDRPHIVVRQ